MDVDALIKKIDYLVKIHPAAIYSTLEKSGKTKVSYKTIPKEQLRADLIKLGADEIERLFLPRKTGHQLYAANSN